MLDFVSPSLIMSIFFAEVRISDVPYIANWIYEHPGLELDLKGIWIADPSLSYGTVQQDIPALRFAQASVAVPMLLCLKFQWCKPTTGEQKFIPIQ